MNVRDSEAVSVLLEQLGHTPANKEADADLLIVNTCSVRKKAESKALGKLGLLASAKKDNPSRIVGIMGCVAQRLKEDIFKKIPNLDFAMGTRSQSRLPELLELVLKGEKSVLCVGDNDKAENIPQGHKPGEISTFVNILLGCNRSCTYCIVPKVRGKEKSRPAKDIVAEIKKFVDNGGKEVTLLGQSIMSYGRTNTVWPEEYTSPAGLKEPLPRLLEAVSHIKGLERIRFTSSHPSGCTKELAHAMSILPEVCEHIHLPVQSGSDQILSKMRRGYSSDDYRKAVEQLRSEIPDISITTDIIVGFPSESVEDFETTREFMNEIDFDNSFIFKYSPRPDTPAAEWKDDVSDEEKIRRNKVLLEDQNKRALTKNEKLIGKKVEVLVEGTSLRNQARLSGRTKTNKIVVFDPKDDIGRGSIVKIEISRVTPQSMFGVITN